VTLAVTSGKGGVGKTSVVVNLAVALARLHNRVAILDADFGLGNVDVLLGLTPAAHLGHVLAGERRMHEILVEGPHGVQILPASSGLCELAALTARDRAQAIPPVDCEDRDQALARDRPLHVGRIGRGLAARGAEVDREERGRGVQQLVPARVALR